MASAPGAGGGRGGGGPPAAGANSVSLRPIEVPPQLVQGEKFIKWDEESGVGTPVTLRVDPKGFYLYWVDQTNEMDLLDIAIIRDTRTGRFAKIPKDPRLRQIVTMGSQDTLEEKTVTVVCANDFVNIAYINFCCTRKEIAKLWTDALMSLAYNLTQVHGTTVMYLQKAHTKLSLMTDKSTKIPVKNIVKMFAQSKDDKKRIETVLQDLHMPHGKNDAISPEKFTFPDFFRFYKALTQRSEIDTIFNKLTEGAQTMSNAQLVDFLNRTQRDPRLNEILHPYANAERARDLINVYEPLGNVKDKDCLSCEGFLKYLLSEDNSVMANTKLDLQDDMDQPLAHYFVNSSHNTYLTGHQLTGKSSIEIYRQCLLSGCRCVELDFWNGRNEEPVIVHGYTLVPDISAKEVLEAIAESAFKTSDYPVILSFENHCNPRQQAKIAKYCREIFGEMLLDGPLESHPLEPGMQLPPPSVLKRKIIIKNKKKHHHHHHKSRNITPSPETSGTAEATGNGEISHAPPLQQRQGSKDSTETEGEDSSSDEEPDQPEDATAEDTGKDKSAASVEPEAGAEISALVNYVQPVHFSNFENAKKKNRCYEMSSLDERQATALLKEYPEQFVNYNKHQLSRIYPAGTRFDSSNFMPQVYWNAGCQLVTLNFQTLDLAMQLNMGIFEYNFRCGYLLKPEFMRRTDRRLNPFAESTVDGIIAGTVEITVISGQFLTDKRVGTYVEVEMYGLPADTVRKRYKTKVVPNNGINPIYDEDPFVFRKIVLPELASIRIAVYEDSGKFIGHRVLPVVGLCPGYRHVNLRTDIGQPIPLATIFLLVVVKDYVPDGLSDFAEALANPIKYQSEQEKRTEQLAKLMDDLEPTAEGIEEQKKNSLTKMLKDSATNGSPLQRPSITPGGAGSIDIAPDNEILISTSNALTKMPLAETNSLVKQATEVREDKLEEILAEPLDKILENKVVKEKQQELDKKLETLRKKHEKKKMTLQSQKSGDFPEKRKLINIKLVKRLSSKNIVSGVFSTESPSAEPLTSVADGPETSGSDGEKPQLPRSHSERLLTIAREFVSQEKELREKYHEVIYNLAEKVMKTSQCNQIKALKDQFEKETTDLMRKLQADHREEVKQLAKIHRNKDQFTRVKREAVTAVVGKGVSEREKLDQLFENRKDELMRQHEMVKEALSEHRAKAKSALSKEFETRMARVDGESSGALC